VLLVLSVTEPPAGLELKEILSITLVRDAATRLVLLKALGILFSIAFVFLILPLVLTRPTGSKRDPLCVDATGYY
jgi:hypothetical protein